MKITEAKDLEKIIPDTRCTSLWSEKMMWKIDSRDLVDPYRNQSIMSIGDFVLRAKKILMMMHRIDIPCAIFIVPTYRAL